MKLNKIKNGKHLAEEFDVGSLTISFTITLLFCIKCNHVLLFYFLPKVFTTI